MIIGLIIGFILGFITAAILRAKMVETVEFDDYYADEPFKHGNDEV
jgi:hypothetical protein